MRTARPHIDRSARMLGAGGGLRLDRVSDTRLWKHNLRSLHYAGGNKKKRIVDYTHTCKKC